MAQATSPVATPFPSPELRRDLMNGLGLLAAGANVVMQLARLEIGHGVARSRVESGSLTRHPFKRTRTTLGYVTIALLGTDEERLALRREVNRQHRLVRSRPEDPVAYDAFDPELQLWVAACLYRGTLDALGLVGEPSETRLDELYRLSARFATTLQVPASRWPADRAAFEAYWASALEHLAMDELTRGYLWDIASLRFVPRPLSTLAGPLHRVVTAGFLPTVIREELGLAWNPARARLFSVTIRVARGLNRWLPTPLRAFPLNLALWDARRRLRSGRTFV